MPYAAGALDIVEGGREEEDNGPGRSKVRDDGAEEARCLVVISRAAWPWRSQEIQEKSELCCAVIPINVSHF